MNWDECIEDAKEELGISGWTNEWDEVVNLAKEKYWNGKSFKQLKEDVIIANEKQCKLCGDDKKLTAHHITYGSQEDVMCVCNRCHKIIHSLDRYGFALQAVLLEMTTNFIIPGGIRRFCSSVEKELGDLIFKK